MDRNRIVQIVVAAAAVGVIGYLVRTSSPSPATPDPSASASGMAVSLVDAAPPAMPTASAVAVVDETTEAGAIAVVKESVDGGSPAIMMGMAAPGTDGGKDPAMVTVDESQANTTIPLARGQKLVVSLRGNPTTGFDWTVTKSPSVLGKPEIDAVAGVGEGGGGLRRFTFAPKDAIPAGEHTVELAYQRGFEAGKAPLKTFKFKVRPTT